MKLSSQYLNDLHSFHLRKFLEDFSSGAWLKASKVVKGVLFSIEVSGYNISDSLEKEIFNLFLKSLTWEVYLLQKKCVSSWIYFLGWFTVQNVQEV